MSDRVVVLVAVHIEFLLSFLQQFVQIFNRIETLFLRIGDGC
jgi:hypothetical protein